MLAIVCSSYEAASTLEKYKENGEVDCNLAFHSVAAALGKHISGRFLVICLEDIRCNIVFWFEFLIHNYDLSYAYLSSMFPKDENLF